MDTRFFFIVFVLLIDHGSPYFADQSKTRDGNAIEGYSQSSSNDDTGVGGQLHLLEAQARSRRETTAVGAPTTLLGGILGSSMGMMGTVIKLFMPGSFATIIETVIVRVFGMMTRPVMFVARSLGEPVERMAYNMLDKAKEIALRYCMKMVVFMINRLKAQMPTIDSYVVELSKSPNISDPLRSTLNAFHMMYTLLRTFGFMNPS